MTDTMDKNAPQEPETKEKKTLSLSGKSTLTLKGAGVSGGGARQTIATRGKGQVSVEIHRKRAPVQARAAQAAATGGDDLRQLTEGERESRARALREAIAADEVRRKEDAERRAAHEAEHGVQDPEESAAQELPPVSSAEELRRKELEELLRIEEEEKQKLQEAERVRQSQGFAPSAPVHRTESQEDEGGGARDKARRGVKTPPTRPPSGGDRRRGKLTVSQVLNNDYERDRGQSLAAQRRAREKARLAALGQIEPPSKVVRDVILPEIITVQDLANRMAERGADVIKALMKMGVMVTINQTIDADTAELIAEEFGHKVRRVTEADVEIGLEGLEDKAEQLSARPPVVTVMGHVDHGKTSLLDALRETDVASGEAGGITQHIGAYQVTMGTGARITFLDTPGHAAFSEMRARGANVTDIVVLVVAADDGIMPQTAEAISHARAAGVPIIVALNKIDLPAANPDRIKQALLAHNVVVESLGGDVLCIEVSAKQRLGFEKLEEAILLQAEVLELRANPHRPAEGVVIEARQEIGRGCVATVLVQNGTLRTGDIFVVGAEYGRVRGMNDDKRVTLREACPGQPVEILGLQGTPESGDKLHVVRDDARAREVAAYRQRKRREMQAAVAVKGRTTLEELIEQARHGEKSALPVVIKADVHGSAEAIVGALHKLTEESSELEVKVLHQGVGGITESDVQLARASGGIVIGFNVRAGAQARELAQREGVDIRYYNIIYNVIEDVKTVLSGLLSPERRESYLGQAEIRQVFTITRAGKVAGCMVTMGEVRRGARVRLLRDDVVIHEGKLKTLKRFKDEVKEVKEGMECGMAFENYEDIRAGDMIECFEIIETARTLA